MSVSVKINPDLARRLNALVEDKAYSTQEEALEDAIRLLIAVKGNLYSRNEVREVLSKYITIPTGKILQDVKQEEES
ncbi:ribbon-helix-helix domain-containing protein [Methanoregula sp.]|jgi:metal-responsive CopG/Arc/MetJ family transcriptional regulator|uniref:ribbon-helix-helix domain-containing protein n=1 Tax=Methanoregula sp. TaxID=2052170 RepID=UPI00262FEBBC|nr:ribbon-helix-helix domain-containing protein [Methanoregula sp.]MDD5141909.1 ribbon-helix-helix domain-containing protein [Methanoregula sp.]